jgi:putative ABC transport system permease protein
MTNFLRTIRAHKWTSFVTIFGFATGLAAALLLLIFIGHELSYDRHWQNGDRIFRMNTTVNENDKLVEFPICLRKAYSEVPASVPGIEAVVQIYRTINPEIKFNDERFRNFHFFYVDSTFFSVFQMESVAGDLTQALNSPDALVLNQRTATKLFGNTNPIGRMLFVSEYSLPEQSQPFRVAAVVPDLPKASHFDFDVLLPMLANQNVKYMGGLEYFTYYLLKKNAPAKETLAEIHKSYSVILKDWMNKIGISSIPGARLIPLRNIYLHSQIANDLGPSGDPKTMRIFAMLTILIMLIAITNFVNLFLVQGSRRSLETGIRKTLGATRFQLIRHFLKESFLMTMVSFIIAFYVASLLVEPFGSLVRRHLSMSVLLQPGFFLGMVGLFLLTALLAGAYPAWYLSKQRPVQALKGTGSTGKQKQHLRHGIVLAQFAICMLLLTNLLVLQKQFNFMNDRPLGFDAKNVVAYQNLSPQLQKSFSLIKNDLLQFPGVMSVSGSHSRPGRGASGQGIKCFGNPDNSRISIREVRIQPDYLKTYGMKLQAGRSFEAERPTDRNAVILNETAVHALGLTDPIGAQVVMFDKPMEVIGVVRDYHYSSLRYPIKPEVFTYYKDQIFTISIRIRNGDTPKTIGNINRVFTKYDADYAPNYVFLQDAFAAMYGGEYRLIQLVSAGSILAILLTVLGLASITAISIQQRTKEIGIRKAIGATSHEIVRMLVSSQIKRLVVTTIVAGFAGLWIIQRWLENYAYRIQVGFWIFLFAGAVILFIALAVTAIISYHTAAANPVESLRYE